MEDKKKSRWIKRDAAAAAVAAEKKPDEGKTGPKMPTGKSMRAKMYGAKE